MQAGKRGVTGGSRRAAAGRGWPEMAIAVGRGCAGPAARAGAVLPAVCHWQAAFSSFPVIKWLAGARAAADAACATCSCVTDTLCVPSS